MSKYLGKILLEAGAVLEQELCCDGGTCVCYVKSSDRFKFRLGNGYVFSADRGFCYNLFSILGTLDFQYEWSVGYSVKKRKGVEYLKWLREDELKFLGGRKELMMSEKILCDDDFDYLCAIQYLFKVSQTELDKVCKAWKRKKWGRDTSGWVQLEKRVLGHGGRKVGSKNLDHESDNDKESVDEIISRCEHNMNVAVLRGYYEWYEQAYRELRKTLGYKFNKDECLKEWRQKRCA